MAFFYLLLIFIYILCNLFSISLVCCNPSLGRNRKKDYVASFIQEERVCFLEKILNLWRNSFNWSQQNVLSIQSNTMRNIFQKSRDKIKRTENNSDCLYTASLDLARVFWMILKICRDLSPHLIAQIFLVWTSKW